MPQTIKKISPEYAKSYYGFVIDNTSTLGVQSMSAKENLLELTENPPQIEIEPDPDIFSIDLESVPPIEQPEMEPPFVSPDEPPAEPVQ